MYSVFWGECMRKLCSNQITELDPQGNPLERGWCALTSLPLFTVHFLSACALLFNAIPRPFPGFHLLLLSPRQPVDGKTDRSSWNEGCLRKWSHSATVRKLHQAQMQREDVHDFSVQNSLLIFTSSDRQLNFVLLQARRAGGSWRPYSYCHIITTFCLLTGWPGGKRFEGVFLEWDTSRSLRASWAHTNIPRVCWKTLIKGMLLSACIFWHLYVSIILTSNVFELSKWCCWGCCLTDFLTHLIAFWEQQLSQVWTILKAQETSSISKPDICILLRLSKYI